jgi:hypothetical protein
VVIDGEPYVFKPLHVDDGTAGSLCDLSRRRLLVWPSGLLQAIGSWGTSVRSRTAAKPGAVVDGSGGKLRARRRVVRQVSERGVPRSDRFQRVDLLVGDVAGLMSGDEHAVTVDAHLREAGQPDADLVAGAPVMGRC